MNTNPTKDNRLQETLIETSMHRQIGPGSALKEPDYEAMWLRMETQMSADSSASAAPREGSATARPSSRIRLRRIALATTLGAALAVVPAYAAIQYDWSELLYGRDSIQEALKQGLGQEINQSITRDGITLTLHTAVIDEGRTLILYSLRAKDRDLRSSDFSEISLQDAGGRVFEAYAARTLNTGKAENDQTVTGYFETDWSPNDSSEAEAIELDVKGLNFHEKHELPLDFDASDLRPRRAHVGEVGVDYVQLRAIDQGNGEVMIQTLLIPESGKTINVAPLMLAAYDRNGQTLSPTRSGLYGTPDGSGGFINQEYFSKTDLLQQEVTYKLMYDRSTDRIDAAWSFPLLLDGSKMTHASIAQKLNLVFGSGNNAMTIRKLTITPTQIRIAVHQENSISLAFNEYRLVLDGQEVEGKLGLLLDRSRPGEAVLAMDRPVNLKLAPNSVIELLGRHEMLKHDGDLSTPLLLKNITGEKQSRSIDVGGYPVTWTYYKQDGHLIVQTRSENPNFGGIGQTYIGTGWNRKLADERSFRIVGESDNFLREVYNNYEDDEAEMHIFYYMEHRPDQQTQIQLYPVK